MPTKKLDLESIVRESSRDIGKLWPLYSFVTVNPLMDLEDETFTQAVARSKSVLRSRGYPSADMFRQALSEGDLDRDRLVENLRAAGWDSTPEALLEQLEHDEKQFAEDRTLGTAGRKLNQILTKWLSAFLDEGQAKWPMPGREKGFYGAWKSVAHWDHHLPESGKLGEIREDKNEAIRAVLSQYPRDEWKRICRFHLSCLPGWVGFIKQRIERQDDPWSEEYPIDLRDYLAVRLTLADHLSARIVPPEGFQPSSEPEPLDQLRQVFLESWEESYQKDLIEQIRPRLKEGVSTDREKRPDAQFVFCIDTRSEIIRRHIERQGNYETHGFAGFFGVPIRHQKANEETTENACPPLVEPEACVRDVPREDGGSLENRFWTMNELSESGREMTKDIQSNVPAAFSYVELSGFIYAFFMLVRTVSPGLASGIAKLAGYLGPRYEDVCQPDVNGTFAVDGESGSRRRNGLSMDAQVEYAAGAFKTMGWTDTFAPVVVFAGHTSQTQNNPYDSSLRCGACAGHSGTPNARVMAAICNDSTVRERLRERGIDIPSETVFLAGEHRTTTDEIDLLVEEDNEHEKQLESIREDLTEARKGATRERMESIPFTSTADERDADRRAHDWAQTRPEWGLARNASFIVGPTQLRESLDLEGRAFLHTYDWEKDPDGEALEGIMNGPFVVCQWINNQYYFSTVDNSIHGSGTKVTQNPVGNVGVLQGNGGDLMTGLPLQSLKKTDQQVHHQPIRLTTLVHAPVERLAKVLKDNPDVLDRVKNGWIHLGVMPPETEDGGVLLYEDGEWVPR